jgi:hypothetical protein
MISTLSQSDQILHRSTQKLRATFETRRPVYRALKDRELLPKCQVLEGQLAARFEGRDK